MKHAGISSIKYGCWMGSQGHLADRFLSYKSMEIEWAQWGPYGFESYLFPILLIKSDV